MVVCALCTLILVNVEVSVKADLRILEVPSDYPTIQAAINNATAGDTIFVHNGTYFETIVVNKTVSLIGENKYLTIIDGGGGAEDVISLTANNVILSGFTVRKSISSAINVVLTSIENKISGNILTDNGNGITISLSGDNVVSDNIIRSNELSGIYLHSSINNMLLRNTISDNIVGINLYLSTNNSVSGNAISESAYAGIGLYYSSDNMISGNTLSKNNYGLTMTYSSDNNIVYHNNFNNTVQVSTDSPNIWTYEGEGNYWSGYKGKDVRSGPYQNETGRDGIGDTPYVMDANNRDNRPLMGTFSDFAVAWRGEVLHITTICNSTIVDFRLEIGAETGNKILRFNSTSENAIATFCRIRVPNKLMGYPYILLLGGEEVTPTLLNVSNETYSHLYFTYDFDNHVQSVAIISSKTLLLFNDLLSKYNKLQNDLQNLNSTYSDLLSNFTRLLGNYSQLQEDYRAMNNSYQQHLSDYNLNSENLRSLMYIFATSTAVLIVVTVYLSKRAHSRTVAMIKPFEDKR